MIYVFMCVCLSDWCHLMEAIVPDIRFHFVYVEFESNIKLKIYPAVLRLPKHCYLHSYILTRSPTRIYIHIYVYKYVYLWRGYSFVKFLFPTSSVNSIYTHTYKYTRPISETWLGTCLYCGMYAFMCDSLWAFPYWNVHVWANSRLAQISG